MDFPAPASARQRRSEATSQASTTQQVTRKITETLRINQLRWIDFLGPGVLLLLGIILYLQTGGSDLDWGDLQHHSPMFKEEHRIIKAGLEHHTEENIAKHAMKMMQEQIWQQDAIRLGHAKPEDFENKGEPEKEQERDDPEYLRHKNFSLLRTLATAMMFFGLVFGFMAFYSYLWVSGRAKRAQRSEASRASTAKHGLTFLSPGFLSFSLSSRLALPRLQHLPRPLRARDRPTRRRTQKDSLDINPYSFRWALEF